MARDKVQFQKGLSEADFAALYGSEEACRRAVSSWRWPGGFECPACGGRDHCVLDRRDLYQCNACRTQTSLTAGTIFANTKLALTTWFRAMYLVTQSKQGISTVELGRRLGVRRTTAWSIKSKLTQGCSSAMARSFSMVASRWTMPISAAADRMARRAAARPERRRSWPRSRRPTRASRSVQLRRVKRFTKKAIKALAGRTLKLTARVVTDGLGCFHGLKGSVEAHDRLIVARLGHAEKLPQFKSVNTALGNIKSAINGTYRAVRKHADRTLAEFEWRSNRRYDLAAMIPRPAWAATRTPPMPYRLLKMAESGG